MQKPARLRPSLHIDATPVMLKIVKVVPRGICPCWGSIYSIGPRHQQLLRYAPACRLTQTNDNLVSIGPRGTKFSDILTKIKIVGINKMHSKLSSAKCRPFCSRLNMLTSMGTLIDLPYRCNLWGFSYLLVVCSYPDPHCHSKSRVTTAHKSNGKATLEITHAPGHPWWHDGGLQLGRLSWHPGRPHLQHVLQKTEILLHKLPLVDWITVCTWFCIYFIVPRIFILFYPCSWGLIYWQWRNQGPLLLTWNNLNPTMDM